MTEVPQEPDLIATSAAPQLPVALNEVRAGLIRQIDGKTRTEPHSNHALRHPLPTEGNTP